MKLQAFLAALMITSTLVHELGHVAAGWCFGYRVVGVRWLPPGVHLRGPRGEGAFAPRLECLAVALAGPLASAMLAGALWWGGMPAIAFLSGCCGLWELVAPIPGSDGWQILRAICR